LSFLIIRPKRGRDARESLYCEVRAAGDDNSTGHCGTRRNPWRSSRVFGFRWQARLRCSSWRWFKAGTKYRRRVLFIFRFAQKMMHAGKSGNNLLATRLAPHQLHLQNRRETLTRIIPIEPSALAGGRGRQINIIAELPPVPVADDSVK